MVTAAVLVRLADVRAEARRDASVLVGIEEALVRSRTEEGRLSRSMRRAKGDNHNPPAGGAGGAGGADAAGTGSGNSGGASGGSEGREAGEGARGVAAELQMLLATGVESMSMSMSTSTGTGELGGDGADDEEEDDEEEKEMAEERRLAAAKRDQALQDEVYACTCICNTFRH